MSETLALVPALYIISHINDQLSCLCSITLPCLILCNPVDGSPPGSSVHGILQARILESSHFLVSLVAQVIKNLPAMPPGHLPNPGIKLVTLASPALAGRFLTTAPPGKPGGTYSCTV